MTGTNKAHDLFWIDYKEKSESLSHTIDKLIEQTNCQHQHLIVIRDRESIFYCCLKCKCLAPVNAQIWKLGRKSAA